MRLQQFVDQVADEELELKKKRQNVADVQDAMKLTENIMAALIKDLNQRRHLTIGLCEEGWLCGKNGVPSTGVERDFGPELGERERDKNESQLESTVPIHPVSPALPGGQYCRLISRYLTF